MQVNLAKELLSSLKQVILGNPSIAWMAEINGVSDS